MVSQYPCLYLWFSYSCNRYSKSLLSRCILCTWFLNSLSSCEISVYTN